MLSSLHRRTVMLGGIGPVVSFSFDDFPRTAYSAGGAILEKFGARGTYYVAAGLMNTSGELGDQFHPDDLDSLLEKGHDLGSQTLRHSSAREVPFESFRNDVASGRKALNELTEIDFANFAYPYGHVTLRSKKMLGPTLTSSRSNFPGFNGPEVDLNLLKANRLYGDVDQSKSAEDLIVENVTKKGWLIFYTHDVRPQPSTYGCTPELFESVVSFAARSGSRILTVQGVLAELGIESGASKQLSQVACR